jgi:hypothetical protein
MRPVQEADIKHGRELHVNTSSFSSDLQAVAAGAGSRHQQVVIHALDAAEFNSFDAAKTIKYNLNRLEGLQLITVQELEQLSKIADNLQAKIDISSLADAMQQRRDASPVAVALAGIAGASQSTRGVDTGAMALSGALIGALLTFGVDDILHDDADGSAARALVCVLAAIGGAAASVTNAIVEARTGS